jgi:hypothetical protein
MTSINAQCFSTSVIVAQSVLDDEHWRAFGYAGRPRRGKLFKVFASAIKLESETILMQEFWGASFGTVFRWAFHLSDFTHRIAFIAKLMEYCIDGVDEPLWSVLRFTNRQNAISFLCDVSPAYARIGQSACPSVFIKRCAGRLTQQMPKAWIIGATFLFCHPNSLIFTTEAALNQTKVANNTNNDLDINDKTFLTLAKQCFDKVSNQ